MGDFRKNIEIFRKNIEIFRTKNENYSGLSFNVVFCRSDSDIEKSDI